METQAERAMTNLRNVLDAVGCTFADVVKTTIFLADMADFAAVNAVYGRFVTDPPPARSTVQVAALPEGRPGRDRGDRPPARVGLDQARPARAPSMVRRASVDEPAGPPLRSRDHMTPDPATPAGSRPDPEPATLPGRAARPASR